MSPSAFLQTFEYLSWEHSKRPASPDAKRKSQEKGRRTGQVRTGCFALRNSSLQLLVSQGLCVEVMIFSNPQHTSFPLTCLVLLNPSQLLTGISTACYVKNHIILFRPAFILLLLSFLWCPLVLVLEETGNSWLLGTSSLPILTLQNSVIVPSPSSLFPIRGDPVF